MNDNSDSQILSSTELETIAAWVMLAETLGIPRSYAQIYGLCFISPRPVTAVDCVEKLKMSRSSVGQGLKVLRELGAIRPQFALGSRSESFAIEPDLGVLLQSVLGGKIAPAFQQFFERMEAIENSQKSDLEGFPRARIEKLRRWRKKLSRLEKLIGR
ncbi:MAG: transcriptional regulator [Opitutales bacterium]|nr:transcriptional regulator [Opitutales bacterium]MCH8539390.1 transcriptional regulator [Opitutales bacterium]